MDKQITHTTHGIIDKVIQDINNLTKRWEQAHADLLKIYPAGVPRDLYLFGKSVVSQSRQSEKKQ